MLQALLRFFSPFRLMKDVDRGTFEERIAAYRYNRRMRGHLSACLLRWALCCAVAIVLTPLFDALGSNETGALTVYALLAAACATFIVCAVCVMSVTAYVYVYLTHHDW